VTFTDDTPPLTPDTLYLYLVRAQDDKGKESLETQPLNVKTLVSTPVTATTVSLSLDLAGDGTASGCASVEFTITIGLSPKTVTLTRTSSPTATGGLPVPTQDSPPPDTFWHATMTNPPLGKWTVTCVGKRGSGAVKYDSGGPINNRDVVANAPTSFDFKLSSDKSKTIPK
jgi:hypothetical protein